MHRHNRIAAALAALALTLLTPVAAQAAPKPPPTLAWSVNGTTITSYDYGTLTSGTKSGAFTLTNSGSTASGALKVTLTLAGSSAGFTKTADTCTGVSLKAGGTCSVTVQYAFTAAGQNDSATLTASNKKASASVTLTGASIASGPNLTIGSPAVFTGKSGITNNYTYNTATSINMYFTVTNAGDVAATIYDVYPVQVFWVGGGGGYSWPIGCGGTTLNPGESCNFRVELAIGPGSTGEMDYRVSADVNQATVYDNLAVTFSNSV